MYAVRDGRGKNEEKVYAGFIFLEQERPVSRWHVSDIRELSWTAERQGFGMQMVSLHRSSRKDDILGSDLFQTIDQ